MQDKEQLIIKLYKTLHNENCRQLYKQCYRLFYLFPIQNIIGRNICKILFLGEMSMIFIFISLRISNRYVYFLNFKIILLITITIIYVQHIMIQICSTKAIKSISFSMVPIYIFKLISMMI